MLQGVAGSVPASSPTGACQSATQGEDGTTYLLCEDLGGSTSCASGYSSNCRVTWTIARDQASPHLVDFDSSPSIDIGGTYSLFLDASDGGGTDGPYITYIFGSAQSAIHGFTRYKFSGTDPGGTRVIYTIASGGTSRSQVSIQSNKKLHVSCGVAGTDTTNTLDSGTTYNVWYGYVDGTNSTCYVCFTPTSTTSRPDYTTDTAQCTYTASGTNVGTVNKIGLGTSSATNPDHTFGHMRFSSSALTAFPD